MKIKMIKRINVMVILLSIFACNSGETANTQTDVHDNHKKTMEIEKDITIAEDHNAQQLFADEKINAIFPFYLKLSEALVNEEVLLAKKAALVIEEGAKHMSGGVDIQSAASQIVSSSNIKKQRIFFKAMSLSLIEKIEESGLKQGNVFIAHCPMAFDNTGGDWLTISKEIRNPYYGDEMLTCGTATPL